PSPSPLPVQASGGPPWGHSFKRPVSLATSSRPGPRHCGQGPDDARPTSRAATTLKQETTTRQIATHTIRFNILTFSLKPRHISQDSRSLSQGQIVSAIRKSTPQCKVANGSAIN